jgi:hypothetical protein
MNAEKIPLRLTGTRPLLMHCSRLSDPLDPITKSLARLTAKRPKTESDHVEIGRIEWYGGLWLHEGLPCIPAEALQSAFKSVAKTEKRGQQAAAGILVEAPAIIKYDGPTDIDELWLDGRFSLRVPARGQDHQDARTFSGVERGIRSMVSALPRKPGDRRDHLLHCWILVWFGRLAAQLQNVPGGRN